MPIAKLKISETNRENKNFDELFKILELNLEKEYKKPPICIEIHQGSNHYRFGTYGNFSVIGGKSKAGKTFAVSSLLASAISGQKHLNFMTYFGNKKIIVFDTEQGDFDAYIAFKRAMKMNAMINQPENYKIFALRQLDTNDRVIFIEQIFEKIKDIGLVVIDGIRDLLIDINNPEQSTEISTKLMQWTKVYNFHSCVVLHENPGSDKLRGHVGTEISNKAEMISSVELAEDRTYSTFSCKYVRGTAPFNEYNFIINDDGLPELRYFEPTF